MEFKDFTAGKDDNDRRFDRVLRIFLEDKSLTEIYKLIRKGLVKLNHKKSKPEEHIKTGDVISIAAFLFNSVDNADSDKADESDFSNTATSETEKLQIVYENEHLLIIDKPYNRSVHGKDDGIYKDVLSYYEKKASLQKQSSISFRPGPLHRLDRKTTGLLVFSLSLEGAKWFSDGIKNHTIHKKYYGIAEGKLLQQEVWQDKLTDSDNTMQNGFYTVTSNKNGSEAQTTARPLFWGKYKNHDITIVEYTIKTGRKHQIRAQSKLHGYPLAGDSAYGSNLKLPGNRDFYLQAFELEFPQNNPLNLPQKIKLELCSDISHIKDIIECCEIK